MPTEASAISLQVLSASTVPELATVLTKATSSKHHPLPQLSPAEADFQCQKWLQLQDQTGSQLHYTVEKNHRIIGHIGFLSFFPGPDSIKDGVSGGVRPGTNGAPQGQIGDVICHFDPKHATLRDAVEALLRFLALTTTSPPQGVAKLTLVTHREDLLTEQMLEAAEIKFERKEPGNDSVASVLSVLLADCNVELLNLRLQHLESIPQSPLFFEKRLEQREVPTSYSGSGVAKTTRTDPSTSSTESNLSLTPINFESTTEFDTLLDQRKIAGWYNTPAALKNWATTCNQPSKSKSSYWIHSTSKSGEDSLNGGTAFTDSTTNSTKFDPIGHISYETTSPSTTKISQLYISPTHRGAGTAGKVLTILENRARADPAIEYVLIDTLTRDYWYEKTMEMSGSWLRMGSGSPRLGRAACGADWYSRRGYVLTKREGRYRNWCVNGEHVELIAVDLQLDVRGDT